MSVPLVNEAIGDIEAGGTELNGTTAIPPIDPIWASMSDAFVRHHLLRRSRHCLKPKPAPVVRWPALILNLARELPKGKPE